VTTSERDLAGSIRAEIASIDPHRRCCRLAESAGLAGAFEPRRRNIARVVLRLGRTRPVDELGGAPRRTQAGGEAEIPPPFEWGRAADHCRVAYLRGRFLAHGSLSLASGRTHLEFLLPPDDAGELCVQLAQFEMPAGLRLRRGRGVVTWKSVDIVTTFLRTVGGGSALLEFESRQVSRSVRGDLNRVINAESANLGRAVAASADQLEAIDTLESDGRLAAQPYTVRLVAQARREEPEATFSDLATRLGIHRSSVQRALERIERLALHPDEGAGRRRGARE
jgi:DNA-binding transcriptional regulator WhiA